MDTVDTIPDAEATEGPRFAPIRMSKFVVLDLATFGLYGIVWMYRNWRYVKREEGAALWPWARALFAPLFYYELLKRLDVDSKGLLAISFLVLSATWRLPGPYWLVSMLAFLALLPAVRAINDLNTDVPDLPASARWRTRDGAVVAFGALALPLAIVGTVGPASAVVRGDDLSAPRLEYLQDIGALGEDDDLLYFYSAGFVSIRNTGVVISDRGVTSYWIDPVTEEMDSASLTYAQMAAVEVNPASSVLRDTVVRISASDGSWFMFTLSPEGGLDREAIEEIERRRAASGPATITA
jgi:hypothetical protein